MLRRAGVLRWTFLVIASDGAFCGGRFELYVLLLSMDYGRGDWLPSEEAGPGLCRWRGDYRVALFDCLCGRSEKGFHVLVHFDGSLALRPRNATVHKSCLFQTLSVSRLFILAHGHGV